MMRRYKVHILYEYGADRRPHGSSFIRLLRPLTYPTLQPHLEVSHGLTYDRQAVDAVVVDRLWRPDDISFALAADLVADIRRAGARFIYTIDDNLLDRPEQPGERPDREHMWVIEFFLRQADLVFVSTPALWERLAGYNSNIVIVPNALDERLLIDRPAYGPSLFEARPFTIGYMGTLTHDDDLLMVLPALQAIERRYPQQIEFQVVGGVGAEQTWEAFAGLPIRRVQPKPAEIEYPLFMLWFSTRLRWDLAIAPLQQTPFTACKSDIKFLDYSALGTAGVYSRVPAYENSVRHLETGQLVENEPEAWGEALETLLADDDLRRRLAHNSTHYLYRERILAHRAQDWLNAVVDLLAGSG